MVDSQGWEFSRVSAVIPVLHWDGQLSHSPCVLWGLEGGTGIHVGMLGRLPTVDVVVAISTKLNLEQKSPVVLSPAC